MKSTRKATLVSTLVALVVVANHALLARFVRGIVGPGQEGVSLSAPVVWLIKLDHFCEVNFYVLIPIVWMVTVLVCAGCRAVSERRSTAIGPIDREIDRPR